MELSVEYFGEGTIVDCEETSFGFVLAVDEYFGFVAEPEGQTVDQFDQDAGQAPDVDG